MGCNDSALLLCRLSALQFQFMRPAMGATVRFRYCLTIYTRFCIYILLFIQSYLIIASILLYLILGNVRKKVFRYSSGLFNIGCLLLTSASHFSYCLSSCFISRDLFDSFYYVYSFWQDTRYFLFFRTIIR